VCTKSEKKASAEVETPIKQCLTLVEKKVRNLEKRRTKLDQIREKEQSGVKLNEDQKASVSQYNNVIVTLEFSKDLAKQFSAISLEAEKLLRKQAKREGHERQQSEIRRIKELLAVQNLLDSMGAEDVRADFMAGQKGAVKLSEADLDKLDELYKLVCPTRDQENDYAEQMMSASEHIVNLLDGKEKEVIGTTYKALKDLLDKIDDSKYFELKAQEDEEVDVEEVAAEAQVEEPAAAAAAATDAEEAATPVEEEDVNRDSGGVGEDASPEAPAAAAQTNDYSIQQQNAAPESLDFTGESTAASMLSHQQQEVAQQQQQQQPEVADRAEDAFFSTPAFQQEPRPFNEIVSSVRGNFDFLQDSELEQQAKAQQQQLDQQNQMAAALRQPQQPDLSFTDIHLSENSSAAAAPQYQTQELPQESAAGLQFTNTAAASSGDHQQQNSSFVDVEEPMFTAAGSAAATGQSNMSQGYESSQAGGGGVSFGASDSNAAADGRPQPIPMPGQYNTQPDQTVDQSSAAAAGAHDNQLSRQYGGMNPNAEVFRMYDQGSNGTGSYPPQQQTAGNTAGGASGGADSRQQQTQPPPQQAWATAAAPDFQSQGYGGGNAQYGGGQQQRRGAPQQQQGSGGYRGGNQQARNGNGGNGGGAGGMNGYRGGNNNGNPRSAPGNQRGGNGGRGGAAYNNGAPNQRGGGPMQQQAGGNGGGQAYKGFPPRNDYAPEGGYQGYSSGAGFMPQAQGGPRGGNRPNQMPRTGGRQGNYGNPRQPPQ